MARGRRITDDLRAAVVIMAEELPNKKIARYTGVSLRSVQRIVAAARDQPESEGLKRERAIPKPRKVNDDVLRVSQMSQ
jgi:hypothetical protein